MALTELLSVIVSIVVFVGVAYPCYLGRPLIPPAGKCTCVCIELAETFVASALRAPLKVLVIVVSIPL